MLPFSPFATLCTLADCQPETAALTVGETTITYGELPEIVSGFTDWLFQNGLAAGDMTGIAIRDEIGHLICSISLLGLGTASINLPSHENAAVKRALARKIGASQIIAEQREPWMKGLRTIAPLPNFATLPRASRTHRHFPALPLDWIGIYPSTSGSTQIPRTFGFTLQRLRALISRYASDPEERCVLRTGSIEFDSHRIDRMGSLLAGHSCVFMPDKDIGNLAGVCAGAKVTTVRMGPYKLASLVQDADGKGMLPDFTRIVTGGARVPGALRTKIRRLLSKNLWVVYATSEAGVISIASPDQHESMPEGVGMPLPSVRVEIVGANDEPVAAGAVGQIRVRKEGIGEYIGERGNRGNFREGWFYPGDLMSRPDDRGPLIFHGRADDVIILNGINVFPSAIEDVLTRHPLISDALAYAVSSRIHGQIPVAAVTLKEGAQRPSVAELLDLCRKALGIRAPRQIFIVEGIPRNAAGKPIKRANMKSMLQL